MNLFQQFVKDSFLHHLQHEEIQHEVPKQYKQLDSENKILKKQVAELRELNINNHSRNEELEQYGRRLCLRISTVCPQ